MKETIMSSSAMIVVSNRLPFILREAEDGTLHRKQCAGGLVTAVAPVVVESGGLWVGWPGMHLKDSNVAIPESDPEDLSPCAGLKSKQVVTVNMDKNTFDGYYNGCCNGTFWPLFHSMPDRAIFKADYWEDYKKANLEFADMTIRALELMYKERGNELAQADEAPLVWIHDYHLMLAANTIRQKAEEKNLRCKLGFFLHIPCPSWDIMRLFPWDDEILQGMLGCDMVGFHIEDYCFNFIDCCQRRLGCRVDRSNMLVEHGGRTVRVRALPIGIPFDRFKSLAASAPRTFSDSQQLILGVDRLDYTKGLVNRIRAFERLLEKHPEYINKVTFLQVAVPSRTDVKEYQELKEEMDMLIGQVNGRFTTPMWSPIRYIYGCISHEQLAGFYRDASVALVTPLRDGMNLVAKEFVACQTEEDPGVLILSPFAGSGAQMMEALLVNPYEIDDVAETIHRALTMDKDERRLRMTCLRRREKQYDVTFWLRSFLKEMGTLRREDGDQVRPTQLMPVSMADFDEYLRDYIKPTDRVALLLDYDGTLAPIAKHPDFATIPVETKRVLERLANVSSVNIAIISGRSLENVRSMVGINNITYAGNHGLEILHPDGTRFVHPVPSEYEENLSGLLRALQERCCRDGAWVENKGIILTYHYREVPIEKRPPLVAEARKLFTKFDFTPSMARCAIEARPPVKWNKGRASIYILRTLYGLDWQEGVRVLFAGDDNTDEDAMRMLKGMAVSFRVTASSSVRTAANRRLPDTDSVLMMLKWVERQMAACRARRNTPPTSGSPPPDGTKLLNFQMSMEEGEMEHIMENGRGRGRRPSPSAIEIVPEVPNGA
ncbi:alpha,alpha-trehalose-phosphate synthase [UDP-forming]-like isoform X2 [Amphibalanus amphitrite]|nr:alpha,alpha-trehalose-phosphate synthase [UDP-forming]-like isoform X2 [Amphibalanus amphitrite]XP_043227658.1 alpha,alpha-trehalose-phosphate synthase [UDP-forming]-like isoform X2 [Amphibalanus amphitrite]XP_043227659.1 alpha,alpha-trehalose-phosphate synthase [UDP-forming]-like isoform X2 [Amphibalanus amphitrite]XP_043227660.1 alpha,alpha-trehalose-phosphate synthase [UDP-forming]-like isoform X2 [Amphibalanus amphitrite]XP_043232009.1 alpha,alpha-trehalose-phosphate synthase [UDP-formin